MKLLALSYYAPPQLTPQAIQVARQLYHLDADVALLHARGASSASSFDQYPDFFRRIAPLAVSDPGPLLRGVWRRAAMRMLPGYGACPDLFGPWRRRARRLALARIAARRPDALVSFGMPMTSHLLGLDLKRATGLPWLAHFSDPWSDNPSHQTSRLEHHVNAALERRVIDSADAVLFTSNRTVDLVMAKYPAAWRSKAAVLPHAWDMDNFAQPLSLGGPGAPSQSDLASGAGSRRLIGHIGALYGARSPEALFVALARVAVSAPHLLAGVAFAFAGHVAPAFLQSAALRSLPPGLVCFRGPVGYRAALQLAHDCAALLVIDAPSAAASVFLPSKLIDYIGAGRPVWGIAPPGAAADLMGEWADGQHACADPADVDAIERMLVARLESLELWEACVPDAGPRHVVQRFTAARVAHGLKLAIEQAVARAARQSHCRAGCANETPVRR